MDGRREFESYLEKLVEDLENSQWPELIRRLGCKYDGHSDDEDKRKLVHKWKNLMDKIQSQETSVIVLQKIKRELFGDDQDINTSRWPEKMRNDRAVALVLYGVIRRYYDDDSWYKMLHMKLQLQQCDIARIAGDHRRSIQEERFKLLNFWKVSKDLDLSEDVKRALSVAGVITSNELLITSVTRFQKVLEAKAQAQTNIDLPIDVNRAIEAVTLQILKRPGTLPEKLDEVGQYNKRREMAAILENPCGNISMRELFALAEENAVDYCKYYKSVVAKNDYLLAQGNNILVTGQAGIGKTTLTKMMVKLILEKEILPETKYLIYIKIRKVDFDTKVNVVDFLKTFAGFDELRSNFDALSYEDFKMLDDSSQVTFLFDGLDEANTSNMNKEPPSWNSKTSTCPSVIIQSIMQGSVFPWAKKLWTSRQRQAYELHEKVRPHTIVQILGLDQKAQDELGRQLCTTEEGWLEVKKYLQEHPDLQAICYVPVICIIAVSSIHSSLTRCEDEVELHTMTDVLGYALHIYSRSDHMRGHEEDISKITKLAWDGFMNDKIIFSESDVRGADISEKAFEAFLVTAVEKGTNFRLKLVVGDKKSSFSHLIWQEMFTAMRGVMLMENSDFLKILERLLESRWEIVGKLMFGLCHQPTQKRLKRILLGCSEKEIKANIEDLKDFAVAQMKIYRDHDSKNSEEKTQKLIQVCTWIKETNTMSFFERIRPLFPEVVNLSGEVLPSDVRCVAHVLPDNHCISLGVDANVRFIANSLDLLCMEIIRKNFKVRHFNLEGNTLKKIILEDFAKCLVNVDNLSLLKCRVDTEFLEAICEDIGNRQHPMETLDLSHNPIRIAGATALAKCLHKVQSLNIDTCEFDDVKFKIIASYLRQTDHSIKLHVGYTNINDQAAEALCSCLSNIKSMAYARCGILDKGFKKFTQTIRALPHPMEEIILSTNISTKNDLSKMSDDEKAQEVANCLKKVKRLKMNCWIRERGAEILSNAIKDLPTKMELLDVSGNKFGNDGALWFLSCLDKVSNLVMQNCGVTKEGFVRFSEAYQNITNFQRPFVDFGSIEDVVETTLMS